MLNKRNKSETELFLVLDKYFLYCNIITVHHMFGAVYTVTSHQQVINS